MVVETGTNGSGPEASCNTRLQLIEPTRQLELLVHLFLWRGANDQNEVKPIRKNSKALVKFNCKVLGKTPADI